MPRTSRFSFLVKIIAALALVAACDQLFSFPAFGAWIGALALGWALVLPLALPALRRRRRLAPMLVAVGFAAILAYDPNLLGWALFWSALSIAALMPRAGRFDDAWRWMLRLCLHALSGPLTPVQDALRLLRARPRRGRPSAARLAALLGVPLAMTALFLALFATANPLIARAFAQIRLPYPGEVALWAVVLLVVWPSLRPARWPTRMVARLPKAASGLAEAPQAMVLVSLLLFNAVFALQNGLDLAFLWTGAPLPDGVTLADYAHRGAYPLIVTALLAGLFVLVALEPGSPGARSPAIRRLVVLWVAQNLLLVASSILRTLDYVEAYSLTGFRIAALAWMALVAVGLALICWRLLTGRSAAWLINANALAAALVLTGASIVDLDASAAAWNVRHAREVGGRGVALDLCYLERSGASALVSLAELERRPLEPGFRDRVRYVRTGAMAALAAEQADWRGWTWRGQQRLEAARRLLGAHAPAPLPTTERTYRDCGGAIQDYTPDPAPSQTRASDPIANAAANTPPLTGAPSR